MEAIDRFVTGILDLLTGIITPDWGALIGLLPIMVAVVAALVLGRIAWSWWRLLSTTPRWPGAKRNTRALVIAHFAVIGVGAVTVAVAFVIGASAPAADGTPGSFGLTVNVPLLVVGALLAIGAAGSGARLWDSTTLDPDFAGSSGGSTWYSANRRRVNLLLVFIAGAIVTALSLILTPGADPQTGVKPVANLPLLIVGLGLAIAAVGKAIINAGILDADSPDDAPLSHA
jgi:hypothetical protein